MDGVTTLFGELKLNKECGVDVVPPYVALEEEDWEENEDFLFKPVDVVPPYIELDKEDWEKNEDFLFKPVDVAPPYVAIEEEDCKKDEDFLFKPYSDSLDAERFSNVGDIDSDADSYVSYLSHDAFEFQLRIARFETKFYKTFVRRAQIIEKQAALLTIENAKRLEQIKKLTRSVAYWYAKSQMVVNNKS